MGVRLVTIVLILGSLWDFFTTLRGVADFFDLPVDPKINPAQFTFGLVVTIMISGFVIASHLIWNLKSDDLPTLLLKAAWGACIAIDLFTSWEGTKRYVFYGEEPDTAQAVGLALVTALIVSSTLLLSKLILAKDIRDKPFLS
jgi:tryptophan-rich sensory protein